MFATDSLSEFNFVLEFNLPKDISDNQEHIKLSVHHMHVPVVEQVCPIGYRPRSIKMLGEIHCIEHYKFIKDVLPLINRWVNSIYSACSRSNHFIEAKLYAYKNDNSLFKKWDLVDFYPLFNPYNKYTDCDHVELIFKFESMIVDDKPMYDISKYIKEYKDRNNKYKFCAYYKVQGGRCYTCKNYNWFVQEVDLKQFIIRRVAEDSEKEFKKSDEAIQLNAKISLRKNVYDDFSKYVEKQKEILDKELEDKYDELSSLMREYNYKMAKFASDNIDKALSSLDSISDSV